MVGSGSQFVGQVMDLTDGWFCCQVVFSGIAKEKGSSGASQGASHWDSICL